MTSRVELKRVILALVIDALVVAAWIGLTMQTGKTYHLVPGLVAALPGFWYGWTSNRLLSRQMVVLVALAGIGLVAIGWIVLDIANSLPSATFIGGQPGGIEAELAGFTFVGALLGGRAMLRIKSDDRD